MGERNITVKCDESEGWVSIKGYVKVKRNTTSETFTIQIEIDDEEKANFIIGNNTKNALIKALKAVDHGTCPDEPINHYDIDWIE
jgi:hypothetical protein